MRRVHWPSVQRSPQLPRLVTPANLTATRLFATQQQGASSKGERHTLPSLSAVHFTCSASCCVFAAAPWCSWHGHAVASARMHTAFQHRIHKQFELLPSVATQHRAGRVDCFSPSLPTAHAFTRNADKPQRRWPLTSLLLPSCLPLQSRLLPAAVPAVYPAGADCSFCPLLLWRAIRPSVLWRVRIRIGHTVSATRCHSLRRARVSCEGSARRCAVTCPR